jgi:hypothetical protein
MTEEPGAKDAPPASTDEALDPRLQDPYVLAWVGEHLTEVRQSAFGQRLLYKSLGICFVVGLAAQVGGYLLRSEVTTELLGLVADLLYALGWSLRTGVVVVVFVQILPEAKRRQLKGTLDAYEAALCGKARTGSGQASRDDEAPTARERHAEQPPRGSVTS